jgi:hypothetical protein
MNVTRLAPWVTRQRNNATSWQLRFISGESTEEVVRSWSDGELSDMSDRSFAELLLATSQDDCDCRELPDCRYRVIASTTDHEIAGTVIKCRPTDARPDPLEISDTAGNSSLQQMVRMNEAMLRVIISSFGSTIEGFRSLIFDQRKEITELRLREKALANMYEKVIAAQIDEDGSSGSSHAMGKLSELVEKVGPTIIAEVMKKGVPTA